MVAATWTLATAVLLSGSESGLDDGDSDIGNSIATVSRVYREDQRRMGTLVPKKLLSCRPRNDGPYDGPRVPSTLHRAPSTGGGAVTQPDNT